MNTHNTPNPSQTPTHTAAMVELIAATRLGFGERYRPRETGTGYGNSSGYASTRRYAERSAPSYFRCA